MKWSSSASTKDNNVAILVTPLTPLNGLNPFPRNANLKRPWKRCFLVFYFFEKLLEKEKMLVISIFSISLNVFDSIEEKLCHQSCNEIVICKCFRFGQGQNSVI